MATDRKIRDGRRERNAEDDWRENLPSPPGQTPDTLEQPCQWKRESTLEYIYSVYQTEVHLGYCWVNQRLSSMSDCQ